MPLPSRAGARRRVLREGASVAQRRRPTNQTFEPRSNARGRSYHPASPSQGEPFTSAAELLTGSPCLNKGQKTYFAYAFHYVIKTLLTETRLRLA